MVRTDAQRVGKGGGARVGQARVQHLGVAVDARLHLPRRHQLRQLTLQRTAMTVISVGACSTCLPVRKIKQLLPAPPARVRRAY